MTDELLRDLLPGSLTDRVQFGVLTDACRDLAILAPDQPVDPGSGEDRMWVVALAAQSLSEDPSRLDSEALQSAGAGVVANWFHRCYINHLPPNSNDLSCFEIRHREGFVSRGRMMLPQTGRCVRFESSEGAGNVVLTISGSHFVRTMHPARLVDDAILDDGSRPQVLAFSLYGQPAVCEQADTLTEGIWVGPAAASRLLVQENAVGSQTAVLSWSEERGEWQQIPLQIGATFQDAIRRLDGLALESGDIAFSTRRRIMDQFGARTLDYRIEGSS